MKYVTCVLTLNLLAAVSLLAQTPTCAVQPRALQVLPAESYTALVPDVIIQCTGGVANGQTTADLNLYLLPAVPITSRLVGSNLSEVLLLVNEPSAAARAVGVNAFLGVPSAFSEMTWSAIPVTYTAAGNLTLRVANVRIPAVVFFSGDYGSAPTIQAIMVLQLGGVDALAASPIDLGLVGPSVSFDLRQCDDSGPAGTIVAGSAGLNPTIAQGGVGQIQLNMRFRELIAPGFSTQQSQTGTTVTGFPAVGTADQGLILAAEFYIPTGMQVYVTGMAGSSTNSGTAAAVLIANPNKATPVATAQGACPLTNASPVPLYQLSVNSAGLALAEWMVTAADPAAFEQLNFGLALAGTPSNYFLPEVTLTLAPNDGQGSFTLGDVPSSTLPIPRFANLSQPQTLSIASSLSFVGVAGGGPVPDQLVSVSCTSPAVSTTSGGNWLGAKAGASGLDVSVNTAGLSPNLYFGQIACSNIGSVSVVLSMENANSDPGPSINPIGLVFVVPENTVSADQAITIYDLTSKPFTYTEQEDSLSGTVTSTTPVTILSHANALSPGIYTEILHFTFSDGFAAQVVLRVIVTPTTGQVASVVSRPAADTATCSTPTSLSATFQSVGEQLNFTATYPVELEVNVTDNCGTPVTAGSVTVSISGETAPVQLAPSTITPGLWSGSWTPIAPQSNVQLTVVATAANLSSPPQTISGNILSTATSAPVISSDGIVNAATLQPAIATGSAITLMGSNLSDGTYYLSSPSLPNRMGPTTVSAGGKQFPLLYVSPTQINAVVPFDLAPSNYAINVSNGTRISNTAALPVSGFAPGVFTMNASGAGQGAIEQALTGALANAANPVSVGDVVAVYATGLGLVKPAFPPGESGDPGPSSPLAWLLGKTSNVNATVGSIPAQVWYAGLTPGIAGLFQVNITIPPGVAAGSDVPVVITIGQVSSPPVTIAVK
jgi:uncharacterized protein (TIGR03437 family)